MTVSDRPSGLLGTGSPCNFRHLERRPDAEGVTAGNACCDFPYAQQGSHPIQCGKRLIKVTSGVAKSVLLARLLRPGA